MTREAFRKLEARCARLVATSGATASGLKAAFSSLDAQLSAEEKLDAVLHFVERDARVRARHGSGDWLAWYFVHGAIRGAQVLPWTPEAMTKVLAGVVDASQVLPPEFVVRGLGQLAKARGLDAGMRKRALAAARSMWPPGSTEGTNFKKAAAKLRELARAPARGKSQRSAKR